MTNYLYQIRLGGDLKNEIRDINSDITSKFQVGSQDRYVPHITLFGSYSTNEGRKIKSHFSGISSEYNLLPYKIDGFGYFSSADVVYADIVPSKELREFRRRLSADLRELTYNYTKYDKYRYRDLHITIVDGTNGLHKEILDHLRSNWSIERFGFANRITALRDGEMMYEYDIPQSEFLSKDQATSKTSWLETEKKLNSLNANPKNFEYSKIPFYSPLLNYMYSKLR